MKHINTFKDFLIEDTSKNKINGISHSVNEGKFKKDDLVYNKRTKTIGIVRMGDDKYGEVKTDADGNVNVDELEIFNPFEFKYQTKAKVAPSTEKEVNSRGLFNPFRQNESVNEALNELALTSTGVKGLLHAIYYNWDTIKQHINAKLSLGSFRDVIQFLKSGDQEEQQELEIIVKERGIEVLNLDDRSTWGLK